MQESNNRFKMNKWFIISIPIAILIAVFGVVLFLSKNQSFLRTQKPQDVESFKLLEIEESDEPGILSQNQYLSSLDTRIKVRQLDYTIVYYAKMFKLNPAVALDIAHNLTDNYRSEAYNQDFIISTPGQKWRYGPYGSYEAGIVEYVRELYNFPQRFNTTADATRVSNEITVSDKYVNGHIMLSNGQTFEKFFGHICDLYGMDKYMALAIVRHESGNMTSYLSRYKNNIGGQLVNGVGVSYPTMESGIIAEVVLLKNLFDRCGLDKTSPKDLYTFSGMYVHGTLSEPSPDWTNKVQFFINQNHQNDPF